MDTASGTQLKMLVVDDRRDNLLVMKEILSDVGAEVVTALSGNDALKQLLNNEFALAILDVQMPDMNGFELASLIRKQIKTLPIIFLTGAKFSDREIFKGYETGAVDFLMKPVDEGILLNKVNVFLELEKNRIQLKQTIAELERVNVKLKVLEGVQLTVRNMEDQINNPLAAISLSTELLLNKHNKPDTMENKYLTNILKNANRIANHILKLGILEEVEETQTPAGPMLSVTSRSEEQ